MQAHDQSSPRLAIDGAALSALRERLRQSPDGVIESIAAEHGVAPLTVLEELPAEHRTIISGQHFVDVMKALESWGEVLLIVHTIDVVVECVGRIPPGAMGRGYYNFHGDSPISGHLKADNCKSIAFVARPFMGRASRSLQFFNGSGQPMFKVFVRRDERKELLADQVQQFETLRARFATG